MYSDTLYNVVSLYRDIFLCPHVHVCIQYQYKNYTTIHRCIVYQSCIDTRYKGVFDTTFLYNDTTKSHCATSKKMMAASQSTALWTDRTCRHPWCNADEPAAVSRLLSPRHARPGCFAAVQICPDVLPLVVVVKLFADHSSEVMAVANGRH